MRGRSRETWIIFSEELRTHMRSRWYLISTLVVVLILVLAVFLVPALVGDGEAPGGVGGLESGLERMGYVDETQEFSGVLREAGLRESEDRAEGLEVLAAGEIDWLYVLPDDYMSSGRIEQYGAFAGRFPSNPAGEGAVRALLTQGMLADQVDPEITARVLAPADYESYRVAKDGTVSELPPTAEAVGGLLVPMIFAVLLGLGLSVGAGSLVQSVSEEKASRLVEVVVTSASPLSIMAGKLLALTAVGLAQAAVWIVATALTVPMMLGRIPGIGGFTVSAELWLIIIGCFITGYFLITALAILVGAIAPSTREAASLGGWVSLVGFVPIWFAGFIIAVPEGALSRVLSYIPFTAPSGILVRIAGGGDMAAWQIVLALVGVAVMGFIVLWISTRVFRAAILMRGQSFTSRNLWTALRRAD